MITPSELKHTGKHLPDINTPHTREKENTMIVAATALFGTYFGIGYIVSKRVHG